MAFLNTVDVAVLQNGHSLSMQYKCHATKKWRRMCPKHTVCPLAKHRKYRLSFSIDLQLPPYQRTSYNGQPLQ